MKKDWFKSSTTVKNPAQAGDAALALHYENYSFTHNKGTLKETVSSRETNVHTKEMFDFGFRYHHGKDYVLEFWGVTKGIVQIPLTQAGSLYESIWAMNFTEENMKLFTHVIRKTVSNSLGDTPKREIQHVDIYRLNETDRYQIANKTLYF